MLGKLMNNEKGSTLMLVLIGFFIVAIFTMTGIFISNAGSRRTVKEEHRTKAYYVAQTGAKTFINHIEKEANAKKDILKELKELVGKTSDPEKYYLNDEKTKYGEFTIKVEGIKMKDAEGNVIKEDDHTNKYQSYKVITTGKVNEEKVNLTAIINPEFQGGGYESGDGRIFSNSDIQIDIAKVPQLKGAGVRLYMLNEKYGSKIPILINDGDISELFKRNNIGKITDLNKQERLKYRVEILEPLDKEINSSNPIKKERLVKYKSNGEPDTTFNELQFVFDTNKKDLLDYFSKGKLTGGPMTDAEIDEGLNSVFLLPLTTKEQYKEYIKPISKTNPVYPPAPKDIILKTGYKKVNDLTSDASLITAKNIMIDKGKDAEFQGGIHVQEKGKLTIETKGDCNINVKGDLILKNPKDSFIKIKADGKVNIYVDGKMDINGLFEVVGDGEVNIYLHSQGVELNNNAKIKNINIYCPNHKIALYDVTYEGIMVGAKIDFNNQDATFKAPSAGPASSSSTNSTRINIEWQN